jgi:hypothetical protein
MRFDLEIPSTYVDLTYISEGNKLPSAAIPLYYMDINYKTKIPKDFLTINEDVVEDPTSELIFEEAAGPSFGIRGNRFIITNVAKYSSIYNTKVPLFYKFILNERVSEFSIKIIDYLGNQLDRDEYIVEEAATRTVIYINDYDKLLFVEYISSNKSVKKIISLQRIFEEITWDDIVRNPNEIPRYKYLVSDDGMLQTSHNSTLYVKYEHDIHLLQTPVANIEDSWYIGLKNTSFKVLNEDSGITYNYEIPEFYIQNPLAQHRLEEIKDKKCIIIYEDIIKLQSVPAENALDKIRLVVKDYFTNEIKYAFTTNQELNGAQYEGVYFSLVKDFNNEGYVQLPIKLSPNDTVSASYLVKNDYYKFRFLNFNSSEVGQDCYFAIYMKPNPQEVELAVFYAVIGKKENQDIDAATWRQGRRFGTIEEYKNFIKENNAYHVATIGISTSTELNISNFTDIRSIGGEIINKESACRITADVFYDDLIKGNLSIPTSDSVIANISASKLIANKIANIDTNTLQTDNHTKQFIENAREVIDKNLDATTKSIIEINVKGAV